MEAAEQRLQVRDAKLTRIVDLAFESPDPAYASAFVNRLAQQYISQSIESRIEISQGTRLWLEPQMRELRGKLAESEGRLQNYARTSGLVGMTETQRADLITVFTPNFDGVKRLDAQIASLETAQRNENASLLQAIRNDYSDAVRREALLQDSYHQQVGQVAKQGEIAIQYGILKREVDTNRQLYNTLMQRAAQAKVASALRASSARLVDPASVPARPSRPNRLLNLLWGASAGLLLGLVFVTARDRAVLTVLLVDASRERDLHRVFAVTGNYGLSDLIDLPEINPSLLAYVTHSTSLPGVSLVATGPRESSALDLLYAMAPLLAELRHAYDTLIIDAPSIGELPDARIFGRLADGVVLVVRAGETTRDIAQAAATRLQEDGTVLLGTVLNQSH